MEILYKIAFYSLAAVGVKHLLGFRFPWEPLEKTKRSLKNDLGSIVANIPAETYQRMLEAVNKI